MTSLILLTIIAIVFPIALGILTYALFQNTKVLKQIRDNTQRDDSPNDGDLFNGEQAEKWFETGDLSALTSYCEQFIKDKPNSVHANWYYALSHYNQGDYDTAKTYFENVIRINPLWRDGAIVYLQEIADRTGLAGSPTVH